MAVIAASPAEWGLIESQNTRFMCSYLSKEILMDYKVERNSLDVSGYTPLHDAAQEGHLDVCKSLIRFGADKTLLCNNGKTPLMMAAEKKHFKVFLFLLENSPDEILIQKNMMQSFLDM